MIKRLFDIVFSLIGILFLFPVFFLVSIFILFDSRGAVFYRQVRVGKEGKDFFLYKFRTMREGSEKKGLLTIGGRDSRITRAGYFLRKYKLDELPQLINVLKGEMSFVGPRPEVRMYVELYSENQKRVLSIRPGITDYASIEYSDESDLLAKAINPEQFYINEIMPAKLIHNLKYVEENNIFIDMRIIWNTLLKIFSR